MKAIVFDTNAYREVIKTCPDAKQLVEAEEKLGYVPFISPIVTHELVAHLYDNTDPHYSDCENALKYICKHTKNRLKNGTETGYLPHSDALLTAAMFGSDSISEFHRDISYELCKIPENLVNGLFKPSGTHHGQLKAYSDQTQKIESDFKKALISDVKNIFTGWQEGEQIYKTHNPNPIHRKKLAKEIKDGILLDVLAEGSLKKAAYLADKDFDAIDPEDKKNRIDTIKSQFLPQLYLYEYVIEQVALHGVKFKTNKKDRANWVWDLQIVFYVCKPTIGGREITLVTKDKEIINAANRAGLGHKVVSINAYLAELGLTS